MTAPTGHFDLPVTEVHVVPEAPGQRPDEVRLAVPQPFIRATLAQQVASCPRLAEIAGFSSSNAGFGLVADALGAAPISEAGRR